MKNCPIHKNGEYCHCVYAEEVPEAPTALPFFGVHPEMVIELGAFMDHTHRREATITFKADVRNTTELSLRLPHPNDGSAIRAWNAAVRAIEEELKR